MEILEGQNPLRQARQGRDQSFCDFSRCLIRQQISISSSHQALSPTSSIHQKQTSAFEDASHNIIRSDPNIPSLHHSEKRLSQFSLISVMSDPTSLLADGLSSFGFSTPNNTEQERFTMFTELPTELRLKIWRHALPAPNVLRLTAHILVSDPTFGFYLTFFMTVDGKVTLVSHSIRTMLSVPCHLWVFRIPELLGIRLSHQQKSALTPKF